MSVYSENNLYFVIPIKNNNIVQSHQSQREFDDAAKILAWNKLFLTTHGIWPKHPNELQFGILFVYFVYLTILKYLDIFLFVGNQEDIIMILTESIPSVQMAITVAMLRRHNKRLGTAIDKASMDFDARNYKSTEESQAFLRYNSRSKLFVKVLVTTIVTTSFSYYVKPLVVKFPQEFSENSPNDTATVVYELPFRFYLFYEIDDRQTYILTYLSHFPFLYVATFGESAAICAIVTLVFHVCGQMSVLAVRISKLNNDADFSDDELRNIVKDHNTLIQMGKTLQEAFSETLLGQLIGTTLIACLVSLDIITNLAKGQNADLLLSLLAALYVLLILYAQCIVGESLITESENVCNAFYDCEWYTMPVNKARIIIICIVRSQKPLCLTAGKFGIFCISTLTQVIKTAMSYFSMLRSLM